VVAEPYSVPDSPNWVGDLEGSTVIGWTTTTTSSAPGALLDSGTRYVAVEWAGIAVVSVYVSSNSGLDAYGDFLDGLSNCMRRRCRSRQVLILGDFNARSPQ
jgi:exonuclease III